MIAADKGVQTALHGNLIFLSVRWRDGDGFDQFADWLQGSGLGLAVAVQRLFQIRNGVEIFGNCGRVQLNDIWRLLQAIKLGLQVVAFRLKLAQSFGAGGFGQYALDQQIDRAFVFAGNGAQALFDAIALTNAIGREGAALIIIRLDIGGDRFAAPQPFL